MDKKNFTVLMDLFEFGKVHLYKDPGMIAYYFKQKTGGNSSIVFYESRNNRFLPRFHRGVRLVRIKGLPRFLQKVPVLKKFRRIWMFFYLLKNSHAIDILNIYHFSHISVLNGLFYKMINPKGFIFMKLDDDLSWLGKDGEIWDRINKVINFFMKPLYKKFLSAAGLISIETTRGLEKFRKAYPGLKERLLYLPDGVDGDELSGIFPAIKKPQEKENIIITVGRIGSVQKNSELLLEAVRSIDLKDWQVYLIGSVEKNFKKYTEAYFKQNPHLKERVIFTGNIKERNELYELYNRARVFCLTSLWESFGLVLTEAAYFGDYIITTRVGAAEDIVKDGVSGKIIETGDLKGLSKALSSVISGRIDLAKPYKTVSEHCRKNFLWEGIVDRLLKSIMANSQG